MLVYVTGGTGFVGSHSIAAIVRGGSRVRVLTRDPVQLDRTLLGLGVDMDRVELAVGDVTDERAVARTMRGVDSVVHTDMLCSYDPAQHKRMWDVNARGTEVVLGAARRAGVSRIVYSSTVWALSPLRRVYAAASPVNRKGDEYLFSKATADMIARHYQAQGTPVVIAYEPALLGPHDPKLGGQNARLRDILRSATPVWPTGGLPLGDVRDTADMYAALVNGCGGDSDRHFGPNRYLTTRQLLQSVRQVTGRNLPAVYLPAHAMLAGVMVAGRMQRIWPRRFQPKVGPYYAYSRASRVDEAARVAVPRPRPVLETLTATVRWLWRSGQLSPRQAGLAGLEPGEGGPQ
jgi:nucleoside-diphosphate-sugar epimerase